MQIILLAQDFECLCDSFNFSINLLTFCEIITMNVLQIDFGFCCVHGGFALCLQIVQRPTDGRNRRLRSTVLHSSTDNGFHKRD